MTSNFERYKIDLKDLIHKGEQLLHSIQKKLTPEYYKKNWKEADIEKLPNFLQEYQMWYSEALEVIQKVIPNREQDFIKLYEQPKNRKTINENNYTIEDFLNRVERHTGIEKAELLISGINKKQSLSPLVEDIITGKIGFTKSTIFKYNQQLGILKSVQKRFESSLFNIKRLLQADLFDSQLDEAKELNKKGFSGAGAMAGVVLEGHLKEVCNNHKITIIKKNPTINDLNQLLKDKEIIDTPMWRKIQYLADLRNCSNHHKTDKNNKQIKPSKENMTKLIKGVNEIIKTLF